MRSVVSKLAVLAAAVVCSWLATPLAAQEPEPVAILDPDPVGEGLGSSVTPGVEVAGELVFGATDSVHGGALWESDGTVAGTRLVVDPAPPSERSIPLPLATTGDVALVSVTGDDELSIVWLSDGTAAGTFPVPGTGSTFDALSVPDGGYALFHRSVAPSGELWVSDGTLDGTRPLDVGEERSVFLRQGVVLGDRVVFTTRGDGGGGPEDLFVTDGTQAGTGSLAQAIRPRELTDPRLRSFRASDGEVVFFEATNTSEGREVWVTAGTAASTRPALYIVPGPGSPATLGSFVADGTAPSVQGPPRVFVWASAHGEGLELYTNDGLSRPAVRLTDFAAMGQPIGSGDIPTISHRGQALFVLDFGQGAELWASDARPGTARRLAVLCQGPPEDCRLSFASSDQGEEALVAVSSGPSVSSGGAGSEREDTLWATDGTVAGTRQLLDCFDCGSGVLPTASLGGTLYLVAAPDEPGRRPDRHLYRLDPGGLVQLTSFPGSDPDDPADGVGRFVDQVGDHLYFAAATSPGGRQLWETDGTAAGTRALTRLDNRAPKVGPDLLRPTRWEGRLAFLRGQDGDGYDIETQLQLADSVWASDGTSEGTVPVLTAAQARTPFDGFVDLATAGDELVVLARLSGGDSSGHDWWLYAVDETGARELLGIADRARAGLVPAASGRLYLQLDDGLYRVDPDAPPLDRIGRIGPAVLSGEDDTRRVATLDGTDYLLGDARVVTEPGEQPGWRLVASDGTFGGTRVVAEGSGVAGMLARRGDGLVFTTASGPLADTFLWRTDGSAAGTERLVGIGLPGNRYELLGVLGERVLLHDGRALWSTDLTPSSASCLVSGDRTIDPEGAVLGERLIFGSHSRTRGWELFGTDGTPEGTRLLDDLWPGLASSAPRELTTVGDHRVVFTANDGVSGDEPWVTDGTVGGARRLGDLRPGPPSSGPRAFTRVGDLVFFEAVPADGLRTLWKVPVAGLEVAPPVPDGPWLTSEALPGFRVKARIAARGQAPIPATVPGDGAADCTPETLCLAGALRDRAEAFVRVVGPKPNGYLWPTLAKLTASGVEVWIERLETGQVRHYVLPEVAPEGEILDGLFDRLGFRFALPPGGADPKTVPVETGTEGRSSVLRRTEVAPPTPAGQEPFTSPAFPGFRFWVRITDQQGAVLPNRREAACLGETICVSGALPGRSEVFLRVIGPRPNGYLWPVVVRFTTSQVEVWVEQVATGTLCHYRLPAVTPGTDEIDGLFDRTAFLP